MLAGLRSKLTDGSHGDSQLQRIEGHGSARIGFEVRARNEYWDLLPYLREYRRSGRSAP